MRKLIIPTAVVVVAAAMVVGFRGLSHAEPTTPAVPPAVARAAAWQVTEGNTLTWTAPERLPIADAAVEFFDGDRLLGNADSSDRRVYTLVPDGPFNIEDLQVRAGGRRLDVPPPPNPDAAVSPKLPAALPANPVDPGARGQFGTVEGEYDLPDMPMPGYEFPLEMRALVIAPKGATGKRPVALFLHGRHDTCYKEDSQADLALDWPCVKGTKPVPSYRGYRQAQELLASQGYVTISISANAVNGQDGGIKDDGAQARSSLVRNHLALWANKSPVPEIANQVDLSKVLLIGHSRGGEGVNRAAMDSLTPPPPAVDGYHGDQPWKISGLLLIGPTLFGHDPVPDVPSATILPGCDGDVSNLQGQLYVDATRGVGKGKALHSALYFVGANHNYFNTEWTPGQSVAPSEDDWSPETDPVCSPKAPTRINAEQQQKAGATYIAAAAKAFVEHDEKVLPLLDGGAVSAPSAGPVRVLSHAIGAARTPVVIPDPDLGVTGARVCEQVNQEQPEKACTKEAQSPHFVPFKGVPVEDGRWAVAMEAGKTAVLTPKQPARVGGELAMRISVPANRSGDRFGVAVTDGGGQRVDLGEVTVDGLPGSPAMAAEWAREVRVPLKGVSEIAKLELTPRGEAGGWLIDAWGRTDGMPDPEATSMPRVDVGDIKGDEGDSGTNTLEVPVTVTGSGEAQVRFLVEDSSTGKVRSIVKTVKPGDSEARIPVEWAGNTRYGLDVEHAVRAKAIRGAFVGEFAGYVTVKNDDAPPKITLEAVADKVAEGAELHWRLTLSEPADVQIGVRGKATAPDGATELSTTDVDPKWLRTSTRQEPEPSRPLSELPLDVGAWVEPGELSADLKIPTVKDDQDEGEEQIRLEMRLINHPGPLPEVTLIGRVTG